MDGKLKPAEVQPLLLGMGAHDAPIGEDLMVGGVEVAFLLLDVREDLLGDERYLGAGHLGQGEKSDTLLLLELEPVQLNPVRFPLRTHEGN